jgi:hypothetical protein
VNTLGAHALVLIWMGSLPAYAGDCSTSKQFRLPKPQIIAGALKDEAGVALSGVEVDLLGSRTVIKKLRTDNDGHYDFGNTDVGTYRLRVEYSGKAFCAPEPRCGIEGCGFSEKLKLNPKIQPVKVD